MADHASRRGAANLGMPLMIVAFLAIGGFMYWLSLQAAHERAEAEAIAAELRAAEEAMITGGTLVQLTQIQFDASPYEGQTVRIEGAEVASPLGTQGFWIENAGENPGNPVLISMSDAVKAEGLSIVPGQLATVLGTVKVRSDSALNAWTGSGAIGEGDALAAEFASHYIEITRVAFQPVDEGGGDGGQ